MTDQQDKPRCRTCRFWGIYAGYCRHPKMQPEQERWSSPDDPGFRSDGVNDLPVIPLTGPDFGCIHHEPTDTQQ